MIYIGTAGWNIPSPYADRFRAQGTHLERYAEVMNASEINSSFYRSHKRSTYERWAACVPDAFRFAVKVPKTMTHERRLKDADDLLDAFVDEAGGLGPKLGPLLVQLAPKHALDPEVADRFFRALRERYQGPIACEPRHATWFTEQAQALLEAHQIARVAADPPAGSPLAAEPGGWSGLAYYRLHGSPRVYYSDYAAAALERIAALLTASAASETWCIFDNTAAFEALGNAMTVMAKLRT